MRIGDEENVVDCLGTITLLSETRLKTIAGWQPVFGWREVSRVKVDKMTIAGSEESKGLLYW